MTTSPGANVGNVVFVTLAHATTAALHISRLGTMSIFLDHRLAECESIVMPCMHAYMQNPTLGPHPKLAYMVSFLIISR